MASYFKQAAAAPPCYRVQDDCKVLCPNLISVLVDQQKLYRSKLREVEKIVIGRVILP